MGSTSDHHGGRAIGLAGIAFACSLVACGPKVVAWPRTPPPERPTPPADFDPQPLVGRAIDRVVVVHPPFRDNRCVACHVSARGGGELRSATDRLCLGCHEKAVARAKPHRGARPCLGCHSPHVSMVPGRIAGSEERMCRRCHDAQARKIERAHQGYPVGAARCTRCHDPHGRAASGELRAYGHRPAQRCSNCHVSPSEAEPLALIRGEREICGRCHPQADPRREAAYEHAPFGAGCTACHEPHAAGRPHLLADGERAICVGCHTDVGARLAAGRPHAPAATGKCHACHSPHAADRRTLLVADVPALCIGCHAKWHQGTDRAPTGADGPCLFCHEPHGSANPGLLRRDRRVVAGP